MALHLLTSHSLAGKDIARQLSHVLGEKRYLHLCHSRNIKTERLASILSSTSCSYTPKAKSFNLISATEFERFFTRKAQSNKSTIRTSDKRFILQKAIEHLFREDEAQLRLFMELRFQLYELYAHLMFCQVNMKDEIIAQIGEDYSAHEQNIFTLYQLYSRLITAIKKNTFDDEFFAILGRNIVVPPKGVDTIYAHMKKSIKAKIKTIDVLVLDGYLYFDNLTSFTLKEAVRQKKEVYLTARNNDCFSFLFDTIYPRLFAELGQVYEKPSYVSAPYLSETALHFTQKHLTGFPKAKENSPNLEDGSIRFIRPFSARSAERQAIASEISHLLEQSCGNDPVKLKAMLKNDIALIRPNAAFIESLYAEFQEVGVFFFCPNSLAKIPLVEPVAKSFEDVYFRRIDFLNETIYFESGKELSYIEKNMLFSAVFDGIKPRQTERPISAYPIGQYVFKIYDILLHGINPNNFKEILYSNWQYTVHDGLPWDQHLSAFKQLETFYAAKSTLVEWIWLTDTFLAFKKTVEDDEYLQYHPLRYVPIESLNFFKEFLVFLQTITSKIGAVSGSLKEHLAMLKHTVIGEIPNWENATLEQKIVLELVDAIDSIGTNTLVQNIAAEHFAENLHAMLREHMIDEDDKETDELFLNAVAPAEVTHYKYVFFPMFEAQHYPRPYKETFPYNRIMLEILRLPKYGIECVPFNWQGMDAHIARENYLFKNVLDFTSKQLIITMTEQEDDRRNSISRYGHDVATLFDCHIPWELPSLTTSIVETKATAPRKSTPTYLPLQEKYSLTELMMFKLCPRRFWHQKFGAPVYTDSFQLQFYFTNILFAAALQDFCRFNHECNMSYHADEQVATEQICAMLPDVYDHYRPLFPIFSDWELSDIRRTVEKRLIGMVTNLEDKKIKGERFNVLRGPENPIVQLGSFDLELETNTVIHDLDNKDITRASQDSAFLHFLKVHTEKTNKGEQENEQEDNETRKKYRELKAELEKNLPKTDRVNLVHTMLKRISIQFASGNQKFMFGEDSGAVRIKAIVNELHRHDFSYPRAYASAYCTYCPIRDHCKERAVAE